MLLIESLLDRPRLDELNGVVEQMKFIPGHGSGGTAGALIKNNLQHDPNDPHYQKASSLILAAIQSSPRLHAYSLANRMTPIIFSRYGPGMAYADHVDSSIQPLPNMVVRTDLSITVFLADPGEYEGGELVVNIMGAEKSVKGRAGDAFLYPTGVSHRVNAVHSGWRKVAIGWIQSLVASHEQREILFQLHTARSGILKGAGRSAEFELINSAYENLLRIHSRP